ncbi:hypothetical protein SAMN05216410_1040 [Sanguibacter gelidistatuariae]|uniref:Uncharacterized protein n=1 Tax=Sanguibacter gelidistatuariae TaxID=1814289 RepID=A0A1G6HHF4_9MICO|nr:hypothetical protein [Sanguibacter gelidistatuariae]SDB93631.1 hypothetical protein SAMN05216410_1040 [Sanguibacter gelidistatuariae]
MSAGLLADPTGAVRLTIPRGWSVSDDVGAASCEALPARADITGRVCAAQIRIEAAHRGALVPRLTAAGRLPDITTTAQDVVRDAFAHDQTAVLVDARPWRLRTGLGGWVEAVRIDLAHHDMTTAMVSTTILVDGGSTGDGGMVRVTASVPVAHHGAVGHAVEWALDSIVVTDPRGPADAGGSAGADGAGGPVTDGAGGPASGLLAFDPGSWDVRGYRPAPVTIDEASFDVFLRGSHKISPRWRGPMLAAGLIEAHGVATPAGHYVRRAVSRPDRRILIQVWEGSEPARAQICADILEGRAVLRSTLPAHVQDAWQQPGGPGGLAGLEVRDMAAVPARLGEWLGLGMAGPGRSFVLRPDLTASMHVAQIMAPGTPAVRQGVALAPTDESPAQLWARLVAMLD